MDLNWTAIYAGVALCLSIFCYNFGIVLMCKLFGVGFSKFSLGFHPGISIIKFKSSATEYILGWFPSGGYVKIDGMIDETLDSSDDPIDPSDTTLLLNRSLITRLAVVNGGNLLNVILLFVFLFSLGGDGLAANFSAIAELLVSNFDAWWGNIEITALEAQWNGFVANHSLQLSVAAFVFLFVVLTNAFMTNVIVLQGASKKSIRSIGTALNIIMMLLILALLWPMLSLMVSINGFWLAVGLIATALITIQLGFTALFILLRIVLPIDKKTNQSEHHT